jgi:hypothetical protein
MSLLFCKISDSPSLDSDDETALFFAFLAAFLGAACFFYDFLASSSFYRSRVSSMAFSFLNFATKNSQRLEMS